MSGQGLVLRDGKELDKLLEMLHEAGVSVLKSSMRFSVI
jgi:hypothetical protein